MSGGFIQCWGKGGTRAAHKSTAEVHNFVY